MSWGAGRASLIPTFKPPMLLRLERQMHLLDCTIGRLSVDGEDFCWTLEDVVRETKVPGKTAIPYGKYAVELTYSNRFERVLPLLKGVPNFTGIRIHSGNTAEDTEGCILVGSILAGSTVQSSRYALEKLMDRLKGAKHGIEIEIVAKGDSL